MGDLAQLVLCRRRGAVVSDVERAHQLQLQSHHIVVVILPVVLEALTVGSNSQGCTELGVGTPDIGDLPELFPSPSQWVAPAGAGAGQVDHPFHHHPHFLSGPIPLQPFQSQPVLHTDFLGKLEWQMAALNVNCWS